MFLKSKNSRLFYVKSLAMAVVFLAGFNGVTSVAAAEVGAPSGEIFGGLMFYLFCVSIVGIVTDQ